MYVMLLQRVLSSLLIVVFGLGTLVYPCAAIASDDDAASHAHHQSQSPPPEHSDFPHAGHLNDCNSVTAVKAGPDSWLPSSRKIQFDDLEAIELETFVYPDLAPTVVSTGPPLRHVSRTADTPVRRHDRLLD